ncbi:Predicted acyltransferase [bacterium A37T11]|nr:Predicted acyltransferase [bacterium A37T11]
MTMKENRQRLLSLDALRGFDMFWISGGDSIFQVLAKVTGFAWATTLALQFEHPDWNGFTAYDCIFPTFLFMAGVSTPFSFSSRLAKGMTRSALLRKAIQRGLILVVLGIITNNGLFEKPFSEMRYGSVLGRIGLAGMFAQIIYLYVPNKKYLYIIFFAILLLYWAFICYFPVPGCGLGEMTMACNPASYLDRVLMPGHLYKTIHDPEGLASTFPAVATGLLGILTGIELHKPEIKDSKSRKVINMAVAGIILAILAIFWNEVFPINKNLWTSSFVLAAGSVSLILLALFYWVIDVLNFRKWTLFFVVIGMNSIVIYMAHRFIDFNYTSQKLFGGLLHYFPSSISDIGGVLGFIAVEWAFMYVLYRNKWFLKV